MVGRLTFFFMFFLIKIVSRCRFGDRGFEM